MVLSTRMYSKSASSLKALKRFSQTPLRHTWASWLRQNYVPTWVLQELGGWKSEAMVRRYAHMSVKHLQPFADQLIFEPESSDAGKVLESLDGHGTKSPTSAPKQGLRVVTRDGVRC